MSNIVEPSAADNIGKNYILNRLTKDASNNDTGEFLIKMLGSDSSVSVTNLFEISSSAIVALGLASGGARSSTGTDTLTFNTSDTVTNIYLCVFVIDPLVTTGTDVFPCYIKEIDFSAYSSFGTIDIVDLSIDLNEGTAQLLFDIPPG